MSVVHTLIARGQHVGSPIRRFARAVRNGAGVGRNQTVYARQQGSVAAPTAGLHFTPEILSRIRQRGVEIAEITLHVGLGTFQPVRTDVVEEYAIHREAFTISENAARQVNRALEQKRRVVAVGTTTITAKSTSP